MNRTLRDGDLPLWNPYSFGGTPFLANGQSGVLYPPRMVLSLVASPTRVHDILLATHLFLAGVAMFLLLGAARLSFPAALVGGVAWMLNSYALAWQALEHYIVIEAWLPLGLLLTHAAVRRRSWTATFGLGLVLALLYVGGNVLYVELALVAIAGYAAALAIAGSPDLRTIVARGARFAVAFLLFVGIAAVAILPTLSLASDSARASLSYSELGKFALSWHSLVYVFQAPYKAGGDPYHHDLFAGTAVGFLAIAGLFRRDLLARYAAVVGAVVILFMVHTPVTFVVDHALPGFGNFKPLARAAFLFQLALAILAAYGFEATRRFLGRAQNRRLLQLQFVAGAIAGLVLEHLVMRATGHSPRFAGAFSLVLAISLVGAVGLALITRRTDLLDQASRRLSRWTPYRASAAVAVLTIVVVGTTVGQEWFWARKVMLHQPDSAQYLYPATPLIRRLEARPTERFLPTNPVFRGSTAMIYALSSASGYESLLPERTMNFWRVVGSGLAPDELARQPLIYAYDPEFKLAELRPELLERAGVASVVAPPRESSETIPSGLDLRYSGADGRIFSVAHAVPRAYVVGACEEVAAPIAALQRFIAPDFAASGEVVLEQSSLKRAGLSCAGQSPGRVGAATVTRSSIDSLGVDVVARQSGWLVVTDSWDRGWHATVDGQPTDVLPADYALRAVRVPAGVHTVRFAYEPTSFRVGEIISITSLGAILFGLAFIFGYGGKRVRERCDQRAAGPGQADVNEPVRPS